MAINSDNRLTTTVTSGFLPISRLAACHACAGSCFSACRRQAAPCRRRGPGTGSILLEHSTSGARRAAGLGQAHRLAHGSPSGASSSSRIRRHQDMPVQRHADAVAHDPVQRADLHRPVKIGAPGLDVFHDLGRVARQVQHRAVHGQHARPRCPRLASLACSRRWRCSPCIGTTICGCTGRAAPQVGAVGMARDVVSPIAVVDHVHPLFGNGVDDPDDAALVAGMVLDENRNSVALLFSSSPRYLPRASWARPRAVRPGCR